MKHVKELEILEEEDGAQPNPVDPISEIDMGAPTTEGTEEIATGVYISRKVEEIVGSELDTD